MKFMTFVAAIAIVLGHTAADAQTLWPEFRGPGGQGVVPSTLAPLSWSESQHVAWKAAVAGKGWSSPVVQGNQVWLTTAIEVQADEAELKRRSAGSPIGNALSLAASLRLLACCYDRTTGKCVSEIVLFEVDNPDPIHSLNSYASPSPIVEPGRVYCHFGCYGTACIDTATSDVLWKTSYKIEHYVGPGSSPVLVGDVLILTCDGADQQFVVAVDKATGKERWRADRPPIRATDPDVRKSYCTPLVATIGNREQVVIPGAQWVVSYDATTGDEFWRVDHGSGFSLVPRPVTDGKHVFVCTGYGDSKMMCIDATGSGDVTDTHVKWESKSQVPTQPSLVLAGDKLFSVSDSGVGQCIDANTGDIIWKKRLAGSYSASPFVVADEVFFTSREGVTTVLKTDGSSEVVRQNQLEARLMATPVVLDRQLLIRGDEHLYSIE